MPQNAEFLWAAYAVATLLYGGYAASLWLRARALARREAALGARDDDRRTGDDA